MSGRFVRQVRLPHHLSFAGYTTSRRRCYSALATARSAVASGADNDNEPMAGPSQTVADVHGSAIHISASEDKSHSDQNGPLHSDGQKGKKPSITPPSPPDAPRKPSNAELYLASLHAAGYEPTFEDLHRFRPPNGPPLSSSPRYSAEYNALADTLCRAFSKDQLRRFLQQWAKNSPFGQKNRRKRQYAESIIEEMWEWPKLKEVERAKQDRTEVSVRTFSVTPSELFLLLGKDGADLLDMSVAFNVHISLVSKPLGLRVEGIKAALKQISEHIGDVKKSIIEESVQLPTEAPIRPDMVQRISRLAGAFLQNSDDKGTVRICAKSTRDLEIAKRLASRASHELDQRTQTSLLVFLPPDRDEFVALFPKTYSFFPFLSPRSLPWIMNTGGAFRVRRVHEWLADKSKTPEFSEGLAGGKGRVLTTTEENADFKNVLLRDLPNESGHLRVKASMGHVLVTTNSPGQRANLVPPLRGDYSFAHILKWMREQRTQPSFVSHLPARIIETSPARERILHRLVYHHIAPSSAEETGTQPRSDQTAARIKKVLHFEVDLAEPQSASPEFTAEDLSAPVADPNEAEQDAEPSIKEPLCWVGVESQLDLMMPDRPMDMQLSAISSSVVSAGEEPRELRAYMTSLRAFIKGEGDSASQPDPPLILHGYGRTYILHSSSSVRRSVEHISIPDDSAGPALDMTVVSESVLDLESNQKSIHCEITCDDYTSEEAWRRFLRQCDVITSIAYQRKPEVESLPLEA